MSLDTGPYRIRVLEMPLDDGLYQSRIFDMPLANCIDARRIFQGAQEELLQIERGVDRRCERDFMSEIESSEINAIFIYALMIIN